MTTNMKLDILLICIENQQIYTRSISGISEGDTMSQLVKMLDMDLTLYEQDGLEVRLFNDGFIEYIGSRKDNTFRITQKGINFNKKGGYLMLERQEKRSNMLKNLRKVLSESLNF